MSRRKGKGGDENAKRREWIGDAIILMCARRFLIEQFPHETVGRLHYARGIITSDAFLNGVGQHMELKVPEGRTGWNVLAYCVEEHIAEVFLGLDFETAYRIMLPYMTLKIGEITSKLKGLRK